MNAYANSRPYRRQLLVIHRAGHLALPEGFFNSPFSLRNEYTYLRVDVIIHLAHPYGSPSGQAGPTFVRNAVG
ncbi:MAG: hypothetical protein ACE5KJ_04795 [Candidatus Zixiibacteriota bacterium]